MSGDLSPSAVGAVDSQGIVSDVVGGSHQLADAFWRVESAALTPVEAPGGLVVCGMGGSAIGADLAAAIIGNRATAPLVTSRGYEPPSWAGTGTLVLCASYSGNTEETLSCFDAAGKAGAARIALTTGGKLADAAREAGVPVIGVPSGFQPRAGVAYMTVAALECAALCGAAPSLRAEVEAAAPQLDALAGEWGPEAADDCYAKDLASRIAGTVPVIYGAGPTAPVASRWKTQINENAERPAFWAPLPEANHNEIEGWPASEGADPPFSAIFLESPGQHRRIKRRVELMAGIAAQSAQTVERVAAHGDSPAEQVLSLVLLGDLVSVYIAVLAGLDPTPVEAIEGFKRDLG